jgi:hypothetical protein
VTTEAPGKSRVHQVEYLPVHPVLRELKMALLDEIKGARDRWRRLTVYLKFEHAVVLVLTALLPLIILSAIWKLALKVVLSLVLSDTFDLTDLAALQSVFGMVFTLIIAPLRHDNSRAGSRVNQQENW